MDPAWVSVGVSLATMVVAGLASYFGTKVALARVEERQNSMGSGLSRLERLQEEQGLLVADHSVRIRVLENEMDIRPPPVDYPRRA